VLTLPPESADADRARGFENRSHHCGAAHGPRLTISNRKQGAVGNGFDDAGPQRACRHAKSSDVILESDALDNVRVRGARMDQRAAQGLE